MVDCLVVGSGPAAVSAARALLAAGRSVTMLDAGLDLEPDRQALVDRLAAQPAEDWTTADLDQLRAGVEPGLSGMPLKRLYGSDFAYRGIGDYAEVVYRGADLKMSLAKGGLSNVWGAAILPFSEGDLAGWPIKLSELEPGYRAVFEDLPLSARPDDLRRLAPFYAAHTAPLPASRQATAFDADLARQRGALQAAGYTFGYSRLGVRAEAAGGQPGCVSCGLCLYGCPYGLIYRSSATVEVLRRDERFEYRPDVVVERFEERSDGVRVSGHRRGTAEPVEVDCGRLFLGCGTIPATAITLESLGRVGQPVTMIDSRTFLLPVLRWSGVPGVVDEPLHTLAQYDLELHDPRVSRYGVHLGVYTYNDLFGQVLAQQLGPLATLFPGFYQALLGRLLVYAVYLHSDESPAIEVNLEQADHGRRITLTGQDNPRAEVVTKGILRSLRQHAKQFRATPLSPLLRPGLPGRGYHAGGTFPMAAAPNEFESDRLGRPAGLQRVHLIDATCFPTIPAPNLTLSVMANAWRIATAVADD